MSNFLVSIFTFPPPGCVIKQRERWVMCQPYLAECNLTWLMCCILQRSNFGLDLLQVGRWRVSYLNSVHWNFCYGEWEIRKMIKCFCQTWDISSHFTKPHIWRSNICTQNEEFTLTFDKRLWLLCIWRCKQWQSLLGCATGSGFGCNTCWTWWLIAWNLRWWLQRRNRWISILFLNKCGNYHNYIVTATHWTHKNFECFSALSSLSINDNFSSLTSLHFSARRNVMSNNKTK